MILGFWLVVEKMPTLSWLFGYRHFIYQTVISMVALLVPTIASSTMKKA